MQGVAQSWLIYKLTGSGAWLGIIFFCNHFPAFVMSPIAGVIADRGDRRRVLMVTQVLQIFQALLLAALIVTGKVQAWHIAVLATMLGAIEGIDITIRHTLAPDIVSKENLSSAIALHAMIMNVSRILGASLAGVIIGALGSVWCFVLNATSFLPMLWWLRFFGPKKTTREREGGSFFESLVSGWGFVLNEGVVFRMVAISTFVCLVLSMYFPLLPVFAKSVLRGDAETLGWLMSMLGFGAVVGAVFYGQMAEVPKQILSLKKSMLVYGAGILLLAFSKQIVISTVAMFLIGFSQMGIFPRIAYILNTIVSERMRGRVMSAYTMTFMGTVPLGSLVSGWCADRVGAPMVAMVGGVTALAGAAVLYFLEARRSPNVA